MTPEQIKEKLHQAEISVSAMQDENLKKIAFETILSQLLGAGDGSVQKIEHPKKKTKRTKSNSSRSHNAKLVPDKVSNIKLNVEQLKELKKFYDEKAPEGGESVVFTLAYFVHEKLGQKKFHSGDINLIYQHLVQSRPMTKPPALSLQQIKRAVGWLVVPSRKKGWLSEAGEGMYEISPQGILKMHYADDKVKKA